MNYNITSFFTYTTRISLCFMVFGLCGCPKKVLQMPPSSEQQTQTVFKRKPVSEQEVEKRQKAGYTPEEINNAKIIGNLLAEIIDLKLENDPCTENYLIMMSNDLPPDAETKQGLAENKQVLEEELELKKSLNALKNHLKSPFENLVGIRESIGIYDTLIKDAETAKKQVSYPEIVKFHQSVITVYEKMKTCSELLLKKEQNWFHEAHNLAKEAVLEYKNAMDS